MRTVIKPKTVIVVKQLVKEVYENKAFFGVKWLSRVRTDFAEQTSDIYIHSEHFNKIYVNGEEYTNKKGV